MLAAVWYGRRDLRLEEVLEPTPAPGQVLIEVARNGLCGSDLHTYLGAVSGGAAMHVSGVVLGHEFAGRVIDVGEGVEDLAVGTAVAVAPIEYCGSCWSCTHGHPNTCRSLALYGGYRRALPGGLAPRVVVSRRAAFALPDGLDPVEGALTEPVAVAVHAVRRAPTVLGASALVLGAGPVGLAVLSALRGAGASAVAVSEPSTRRRTAASRLGATVVVDPDEDGGVTAVRRTLDAEGVDLVFDTTAVSAAVNAGIRALRPHGTLVSVAGWSAPAELDMGVAMAKEIAIRYTMTYEPEVDFPAAIALLSSGVADPGVLISDHIPLHRVVWALEELLHHNDAHVKILVDPAAT